MQIKELLTVAEDLVHLRADWTGQMSDAEIRRGSAVLRRLLIEDVYGKAWRAVGNNREPTVIAIDLQNLLGDAPLSSVELALAGGVNFRGITMAGMMLIKGNKPPEPSSSSVLRARGFPGERSFSMSEYLHSLAGVIRGRKVTRREVVKYIANVRGGVHLGKSEKKREKKLVARLEKLEQRTMVHTTDGLLVEAAAIGQAIGSSDDAQRLVCQIERSSA